MTKITLILTILVGILFGAIVQANAAQQVAIAGFRAPCITKQECKDETLVTLGIDEEQARALQPQWLWVATPRGYVWAYLTPGGPNGTIWGLVNRLHKSPEGSARHQASCCSTSCDRCPAGESRSGPESYQKCLDE